MKTNKKILDVLILILFTISIILLINPLQIVMVSSIEMIILGIINLIVITVLLFTWKEHPADEREEMHLKIASRISFLGASLVLLLALTIQALQHNIDPWIALSLLTLIITKIVTINYLRIKK